jgi:aryl-alcohol dehydrogenase-like predicted oxidoreductase
MKHIRPPLTELDVSAICYGGGGLGSGVTGDRVDELLNAYRDGGGNIVDSAHCYGFWSQYGEGASERAIADYIGRNGRGDLIITTKGGHPGLPGYRKVDVWLSPHRIEADVDDSLGRLRVDTIDLYWLHRDDTRLEVATIIDTLNREVQRGRIRYLGASNWTVERIEEANAYAEEHGLRGFCASQVEWSLAHREPPEPAGPHGNVTVFAGERETAFHERTGLPIFAYTSTASGYFAPGTRKRADFDNPTSRGRRKRAEELASELGVTANQVALAWLLNQPFPVVPITGTSNLEHLAEAVAAVEIELTPDQLSWLRDG